MDHSDFQTTAAAPLGIFEVPHDGPCDADHGVDLATLTAELGREIASPLTAALERLDHFDATGRIERSSLAAMRREIDQARRAGMIGQQLSRLARGRIRQQAERLDLTRLLREAVDQRAAEIAARGLEVRQSLKPAEVIVDASLVFSLLQALLDWSLAHALGRIELAVDVMSWPVHARIGCRFPHRPADRQDDGSGTAGGPDTIAWRLVQQIAHSMGLSCTRQDTPGHVGLTIEFPRTANERVVGMSVIELDPGNLDSRPLAGSHVLVIAARRDIRTLVREAIRTLGLMIDFSASVDEARAFCQGGLPHAIVYESALGGERFDRWRRELLAREPSLSFVAIGEEGREVEATLRDGHQLTHVGRDAVPGALPSVLVFELTRALAG